MDKVVTDAIEQLPDHARYTLCKNAVSDAIVRLSNLYGLKAYDVAAMLNDIRAGIERAQYEQLLAAYYSALSDEGASVAPEEGTGAAND